MTSKYRIIKKNAEPIHQPPARFEVIRSDDCINCGKCASVCLYDVHDRDTTDPRKMAEPVSYLCRKCFSCVQLCTTGALSLKRPEAYTSLGDEVYEPEDIISIQEQALNGEVPVSGGGYGGPFAGPGFDGMWTDMSEIVRPTRDGIHGREYISTSVELGRKPTDVCEISFDDFGNPLSNIYPSVEIMLPLIIDMLPFFPSGGKKKILHAVSRAATKLRTFAVMDGEDIIIAEDALLPYMNHVIPCLKDPLKWRNGALLNGSWGGSIVEIPWSPEIMKTINRLKVANPDLIILIRVDISADTLFQPGSRRQEENNETGSDTKNPNRASAKDHYRNIIKQMAIEGAEIIHVVIDPYNGGINDFPWIVRQFHQDLVEAGIRDQVTLIASGGMHRAEHIPKTIIMGADSVGISVPVLIALGCIVCSPTGARGTCPVGLETIDPDWGAQRIINLMAAWHDQLLEILGAMGLREVSRLRGETGRLMFKEDLDREIFQPIFGGETKKNSRG